MNVLTDPFFLVGLFVSGGVLLFTYDWTTR